MPGRARGRSKKTSEDPGAIGTPPSPSPPPPPIQILSNNPPPHSRSSRGNAEEMARIGEGVGAMRVSDAPRGTSPAEPSPPCHPMPWPWSPENFASSSSSRAEADPEGATGGHGDAARGAAAGAAGGRLPSNYVSEVIFGGYACENKKDFQSYVTNDTRPKNVESYESGSKGEKIEIYANSFKLDTVVGDVELQQYHVSYEPVQDSTRKRIELLRNNINRFTAEDASTKYIFDGAVLFLPKSISLNRSKEVVVATVGENDAPIRMTIKYTATLSTSTPTVKQILNRIFRDAQNGAGLVQIGRHFFDPERPSTIRKYAIEIWPGFSTRIDQYDGGIMVTIDTISKVMKDKQCLEQMTDWCKENPLTAQQKTEKEIVGETVLTKYNNKNYRIDGIDWEKSPLSEFTKSDGSTITYKAYYMKHYGLTVVDEQPLLIHRPKPKETRMRDLQGLQGDIHLVPELCYLTGLGTMRQDFNVMREVAKETRFNPRERVEHMTNFIRHLQRPGQRASRELDKLNMRFDQDLVRVEGGRLLDRTAINQGGRPLAYSREQSDWSRALSDGRFNQGILLECWQVFMPRKYEAAARKFVEELIGVGRRVDMDVRMPEYVIMQREGGADYISRIRAVGDSQMIMCVLPDDKKDRYDAIKQLLCIEKPMPSQLILGKTCSKEKILRSVATKVLMQMNCKLQGTLWDAGLPINEGVLMVVGVDTFIDQKMASKGNKKVNGALVASYDKQATKWFSRHLLQSPNDTLEEGLKRSLTMALLNYKKHNGSLPKRVMIYRDGVGDGQLSHVQRVEVNAYVEACKACNADYRPKLTVTIVTKRVPQRFFLKRGPNDFVNPQPGTVVDGTVTKHDSEMYDYYVVSQATNQGTVSPTHYNIIYDDSEWDMDRHQCLAYKLCHLYYNWAGAIRVPAPCQYAHKLAFMVNQNLHRAPTDELGERLWYL